MNYFENQWVEVFRAGEQTDSTGRTRNWNSSDLEEIVNNYNAKTHEAPIVIGHPKENAPAFGWVEGLKTDGKVLFAKFKQLVPEFVNAVKNGMYKKRSISLYPDLTLRHVGFLGAIPPAVKGLADIKFTEKDSFTIELETSSLKKGPVKMTEKKSNNYSEINHLRTQLKKEQMKNKRSEFKEFVNKLHSEGKIVSESQETIIELMQAMDEAGKFEFSEGKTAVLDKFREYLKNQPIMVEFGETVKEEPVQAHTASEKLNLLAIERANQAKLSFSEALSLVQAENIDLAQKAAREI